MGLLASARKNRTNQYLVFKKLFNCSPARAIPGRAMSYWRMVFMAILALELDAQLDGQAVVGVVLEVRVIRFVVQMLDGVLTVTIPKKG